MSYDTDRIDAELYDYLRNLARNIHRERSGGQTLQPTALINEAWVRLKKADSTPGDRAHFVAMAAQAMRHVLQDRARALQQKKRGPGQVQTTLSGLGAHQEEPLSLLSVEQALSALRDASPRDAEVVLLRSIGGLSVPEIAQVTEMSISTVERSWRRGKAFLVLYLSEPPT